MTFIIDGEPTVVEFEHASPVSHQRQAGSFLDVAKKLNPLEHACGGSCACTTCHVIIPGRGEPSEMQDDEPIVWIPP